MKKTCFHILVLTLAMAGGTSAAQSGLPPRGPDYFRDAADLAGLLGAAHAVRVRCNGSDDQYWRRYMSDMLAYEAPEPGTLRSAMVSAFNSEYSRISSAYPACDGAAVDAEAGFAREGQQIAARLAAHYFPKRRRRDGGPE